MFEAVIYYAGPKTRWSKKIDSDEILARWHGSWRWALRYRVKSAHALLDADRCGYAVLEDGEVIEHVEALA